MTDSRARLLRAALGFLALEPREPELRLLHRCFDTWRGIGDIVAGMARQGYDLELRRYDGQGWRAGREWDLVSVSADGRHRALPQLLQPRGDCHAREEAQEEDRTQTRRLQEEAAEAPCSRRRLKLGRSARR